MSTNTETKSKTPFLDACEDLEARYQDANHAYARLLRDRGWEHTSSTPTCCWMWKKTHQGITYMVDQATAIEFERVWCGERYEDSD